MRLWFSIFTLVLIQGCIQRDRKGDCSRFKNGKFVIKDERLGKRFIISRLDTVQTELDESTDTITVEKIKWTGPCEYELVARYKRKYTIDSSSQHAIFRYVRDAPLIVKIIESGRDYYVFEAKEGGIDFIYRDTMRIYR